MKKQLLKERFQQLAGIRPLYISEADRTEFNRDTDFSKSAADRAAQSKSTRLDVSELNDITQMLKKDSWEGPKDDAVNQHAKIYEKETENNIYNLKINKGKQDSLFSVSVEVNDANTRKYNTELENTLEDKINSLGLSKKNELNDDFYGKLGEFLKSTNQ